MKYWPIRSTNNQVIYKRKKIGSKLTLGPLRVKIQLEIFHRVRELMIQK